MKIGKLEKSIFSIFVLVVISLYIVLPAKIFFSGKVLGKDLNLSFNRPYLDLKIGSIDLSKEIELKQGLDIKGGVQVTLKADMSKIDSANQQNALESLKNVVARRVDMFGVSEATVKTALSGTEQRVIVELPGVTDTMQAVTLIGETASLEFALPVITPGKTATDAGTLTGFEPTGLTGADLQLAQVTFETDNRLPAVAITFKESGREKFAKLTKENIQKPIAILLDGQPITMPVVQAEITGGQAQITGNFTPDEAKALSVQLNAGALPVPVEIISQKNIPATLGAESIRKSVIAGIIGLSMVMLFMSLYYGKLGLVASLSLLLYGVFTLAVYKIIPVVLSLPGIAGFILSVGMAVDSNILIFERYKEEIREGRPWHLAMELAFGRAWDSIKDANTATIITGLILFNPFDWNFLNTSGAVRGFALTLVIGILISLFTGIYVTRNLLRLLISQKALRNKSL